MHFAHLTDPHLTDLRGVRGGDLLSKRVLGYLSWRRRRRWEHRPEVLAALVEDIHRHAPQQVLVTGDLTHIGLPGEFRQARDWLRALGEPRQVGVVPGNHDAYVRAPAAHTLDLWRDYLSGDGLENSAAFPSLRRRGDVAFIGVSTARPSPPLFATGRAGGAQLRRLAELLAACRGLFRVVYLHHCPLPGAEKWRKRLTDAAAVTEVLQAQGAELVLHGHGHRSQALSLASADGPIPVLTAPSASARGRHSEAAAWHLYQVLRQQDGWLLRQQPRRYVAKGAAGVAGVVEGTAGVAGVVEGTAGGVVAGEPRQWQIRRPAPPPAPGSP